MTHTRLQKQPRLIKRILQFSVWCALGFSLVLPSHLEAGFIGDYGLARFTLTNAEADGTAVTPDNGLSLILTGGNNGSYKSGSTTLTVSATGNGWVKFNYLYTSLDLPSFDYAGYLNGGQFTWLADTTGQSGTVLFPVLAGQTFGFAVGTADNTFEPGVPHNIELRCALQCSGAGNGTTRGGGIRGHSLCRAAVAQIAPGQGDRPMTRLCGIVLVTLIASMAAFAQPQSYYAGSNVTGQLVLVRSVNVLQQAQAGQMRIMGATAPRGKETLPKIDFKRWTAPALQRRALAGQAGLLANAASQSIAITPAAGGFGFDGITHAQQRLANGGNQYSVGAPEPQHCRCERVRAAGSKQRHSGLRRHRQTPITRHPVVESTVRRVSSHYMEHGCERRLSPPICACSTTMESTGGSCCSARRIMTWTAIRYLSRTSTWP